MSKKTKENVTVIVTVKNEENTIRKLLNSLMHQSLKPKEIIVVDGGSSDGTWEILRKYCEKFKILKCFRKFGLNIAQGRNIAIRKAKSKLIASIDGGCYADKNWLKNLVKKWKETNSDVVAGVFKPWIKNQWDEIEGYIQCPDIRKLKDGWEPSSRSVLFTKEIWEKVGGYPEDTYTAEDTMFNKKLKAVSAKYALARNAIVYWKMRGNLSRIFRQFYLYGIGDRKTHMWVYKKFIILFYLLFPLSLLLETIYRVKKRNLKYLLFGIAINCSKRLGYLYGLVRGGK